MSPWAKTAPLHGTSALGVADDAVTLVVGGGRGRWALVRRCLALALTGLYVLVPHVVPRYCCGCVGCCCYHLRWLLLLLLLLRLLLLLVRRVIVRYWFGAVELLFERFARAPIFGSGISPCSRAVSSMFSHRRMNS